MTTSTATSIPHLWRNRLGHRLLRIFVWTLLGSVAALGIGMQTSPALAALTPTSASEGSNAAADAPMSAAERTIAALTGPQPAAAMEQLPADFADVMGFTPILIDGYPERADGDCSSPIPMPEAFEPACRTHDLGYDLLRYGEAVGTPVAGWGRLALDRQLVDRMIAVCDDVGARVAAELARAGLGLNTWRQYDGLPTEDESLSEIARSTATRAVSALGDRGGR